MARVFERGLTEPSGYVLPVQRWQAKADGTALAQREMEDPPRRAVPGAGRLPGRLPPAARLAALCAAGRLPLCRAGRSDRCRAGLPAGDLPRRRRGARRERDRLVHRRPKRPARSASSSELGEIDGAVRTALTVEPRDGRLCVFMPPVERLEDYLELVAAAESGGRDDRPAGAHRGLPAAASIRA